MTVDFPAPFSPTRPWTSPALTSMLAPSSARTPGNVLTMSRRLKAVSTMKRLS